MKTSLFIIIVLFSGCIAGTVHGLVNLAIVEPYLDAAIGIENQHLFESGEAKDTPEFWAEYSSYRVWQKGGQILAGAILGTSIGALFGIVFGYAKNVLPGGNFVKKSLFLAAIMWATLYIIPMIKYPANPPTVGDPETIVLRQALYVAFIAISGLGALGFYYVHKKISKKALAFAGYAGFMALMFAVMPNNPDPVTAPEELVTNFRITSAIAVSSFWLSVAVVFGTLWQKLQPDKTAQSKIQ
jgi:predicted cobalt transporter CbtA